jgi:hypothetical protein
LTLYTYGIGTLCFGLDIGLSRHVACRQGKLLQAGMVGTVLIPRYLLEGGVYAQIADDGHRQEIPMLAARLSDVPREKLIRYKLPVI